MATASTEPHYPQRTIRTQAVIASLTVALLLFVYHQTFLGMARVWLNSVTFRHGLVIIPITLWLIWYQRKRLLAATLNPSWWASGLLVLLTAMWLLGRLTDVSVVQELAMIAMIPTCVMLILGRQAFDALRFPLLYLFFAVPVGWFLVPPLMHVTATMAVKGLQWSGVPVFQEGFRISVPTGDFLVADACSGIRYLIACIALGTLFAYLFYRSRWRRLLFMLVAFSVPVVANGIRAYGIILLAYLSDMRIATGFDHVIYGFIFFSFLLFLMFWIGSLFREDTGIKSASQAIARNEVPRNSASTARVFAAGMLALLIASLGPLSWAGLRHFNGISESTSAGSLFAGRSGWRGPASVDIAWHPKFAGRHRQFAGAYERGGQQVDLFIESYPYPRQGKGVVSSLNGVSDNPHQLINAKYKKLTEAGPYGTSFAVREAIVRTRAGQRLIWSWYRVAHHSTPSRLTENFLEALNIMRGGYGWARWISISTPINDSLAVAQSHLQRFLDDNYTQLLGCLSPSRTYTQGCASVKTISARESSSH